VPPERLLGIIFSEDDDEPNGLMSGHPDADTNSR
jgi:hypothetical protein